MQCTRTDCDATHSHPHNVLKGPQWIYSYNLGWGPLHTISRHPLSSSLSRPVMHSSTDTGRKRLGRHRSGGLGTLQYEREVLHTRWCRSADGAVCTSAWENSGLASKALCSVQQFLIFLCSQLLFRELFRGIRVYLLRDLRHTCNALYCTVPTVRCVHLLYN